MKKVFLLLVFLFPTLLWAQPFDDEPLLETITTFFDGFKEKDGDKMWSVTDKDARLVITTFDTEGKPFMRSITMESFIPMIANRKDELVETFWFPQFYVHDNLATVWVNYNLYVDGKIDHCGKDSFQLFKSEAGWKIIAVADTQRRSGCLPEPK